MFPFTNLYGGSLRKFRKPECDFPDYGKLSGVSVGLGAGGRIKEAADLLGLSYKTLQYRLKKHAIDRHDIQD